MGPGETAAVRLRLTKTAPDSIGDPFGGHFAQTLERRRREADEFYRAVTPAGVSEDAANVMRQALAGMLWSKQYYFFDLAKWLEEHGGDAAQARSQATRNREWTHMVNDAIISMPDKWEYPWFAAWDLAFHTIALSTVDIDFAEGQLELMLKSFYLHPTGQIPAYEWNFGDVNPPVHAWAAIFLHRTEQALGRDPDLGVPRARLRQAVAEFHLVDEPQGPVRQEPLRGRLPGPRQHRRVRPQRAAADRGLSRTGRRDGLDGAVLSEHARTRRGADEARSGL